METSRDLATLISELPGEILTGSVHCPVKDLKTDSRHVQRDTLFTALRGTRTDGHLFLAEALDRGAGALVVEELPATLWPRVQAEGQTVIRVPDCYQAVAMLASAYYQHPARQLSLIGITGTNGKTTTAYIVESILQAAGESVGMLGTVGYHIGMKRLPAPQTTPDATLLQDLLSQMVAAGTRYAVMEVSSHALTQERVRGCPFAVAAFTNLSRDHFDYHGSESAYFNAKARLFRDLEAEWHVLNLDDPYGRALLQTSHARPLTYGLASSTTLKPHAVHHGLDGIRFVLPTSEGPLTLSSTLVGRHNIYNLLAGIGIAQAVGIDAEAIRQGVARLREVPGRLERVACGQDVTVFVDYAHTPAALEQVLRLVRAETAGRLITVFGCGGDRDPGKRPLMGQAATAISDYTIITSDNPRTEDPQRIIDDIVDGLTAPPSSYTAILDRRQAIEQAIAMAQAHDTVVIAGKGHEDYQIIGDQRCHFDDRDVARAAFNRITR